MKAFHSVLWSSLLVLSAASHIETEADAPDVCQDEGDVGDLLQTSSVWGHYVEEAAVIDNFLCVLYPTHRLNCSWSFPSLQTNALLFVSIRVCSHERPVDSLNLSSEERVGSWSLILPERETLYVVLQFNVTLGGQWTVYTYTYDMDSLEVLSPPPNISASVTGGDLLVTWDLPYSRVSSNPSCFEYQLDMGDQERPRDLTDQLSHAEPNADPDQAYRVRMRARMADACRENPQWSDWSRVFVVERSTFKFNTILILTSLGIPMILLAVLLVLRCQRVSKVLFPPIPHPPPKFIYFLEKDGTFNFFHPVLSAEPMEEITVVEDTEKTLERHFESI